MTLWLIGNTTVRSPLRLRDGLLALSQSDLQGNLRGEAKEKLFCQLLSDCNIVTLKGDASYSVGRKWRSAMGKLGFLVTRLEGTLADRQAVLGPADMITENGWRLINSQSLMGWNECFLRSLAGYMIPSVIETRYQCAPFSPLRFTLAVMLELEKLVGENRLSFIEMSVLVQCSTPAEGILSVAQNVLALRRERENCQSVIKFDASATENAARKYGRKPDTFRDYADTNMRYLKATGLVQSKGKGIALVPEKIGFIHQLIAEDYMPDDGMGYLQSLYRGVSLPTDDKTRAQLVLMDLVDQLKVRGENFDVNSRLQETTVDIDVIRHEVEERLLALNELEYAANQANCSEEISKFMELLIHRKYKMTLSDGEDIEIPRAEAPAYFEWIVWRAFLSLQSSVNQPWEARSFKIDQDFLPVAPAPGGRPDMVFEFDDMMLIVEVTLTASSRQEAAEGESVRRHVAKYAAKEIDNGKSVYGLFIAINVDTNTANTFRLGEWYLEQDRKIDLHIVPMTLQDFSNILVAGKFDGEQILPGLKPFLIECRSHVTKTAPEWKNKINELSNEFAARLKLLS